MSKSFTGLEDCCWFWPKVRTGNGPIESEQACPAVALREGGCLAGLPAAAKALARQAMSELPKEIKPEFPF
jgi:hypothetical protein